MVEWGDIRCSTKAAYKVSRRCLCHTCNCYFHPKGIGKHKAQHEYCKQYCKITFSSGKTEEFNFQEVAR